MRRLALLFYGLSADKQRDRLEKLFRADAHVEAEATWGIYQRMITASGNSRRRRPSR